jgi:AmmeMemoRadiSam system protein A
VEPELLTAEEQETLLDLARRSVRAAAANQELPVVDLENLPPRLREEGVSFVTLTGASGALRGCIGALQVTRPLALDVVDHAAAAATTDYRFAPVESEEVPRLHIEISVLTPPQPLAYENPAELPRLLRPGVDGVVLRDGPHRATFLPQVWEKLPQPEVFLNHLCEKMGAPANLWKRKKMTVETYQVIEFSEK